MTTALLPQSEPTTRRRRRRTALAGAAAGLLAAALLSPATPANAAPASATCSTPLIAGLTFETTLEVTATAPATAEAGDEIALTDIAVSWTAADLGAPPDSVIDKGKLTLTNGLVIDLGQSAPSVDGATYEWSDAGASFTAMTAGTSDFEVATFSASQGIIPFSCPASAAEPFASTEVTAAPITTTTAGVATTVPPSTLAPSAPAPPPAAKPVAGSSTYTG